MCIDIHRDELVGCAAVLYGIQHVYGDTVRNQTRAAYCGLRDAHAMITGVLAGCLLRIDGKTVPVGDATSCERRALFATYVIGLTTCESAIEEGRYLQASALVRQEMEILAQLKLIRSGSHSEGQQPNVGVLEASIRRLYGDLSTAAHVSKQYVVSAATAWQISGAIPPGSIDATRYFPAFDEQIARRLFALHLMLAMGVLEEFSIDLHYRHDDEGIRERDVEALNHAAQIMIIEGVLESGAAVVTSTQSSI